MEIEQIDPASAPVGELAEILLDAVQSGASVGFLDDLSPETAVQWWRGSIGSAGVCTYICRDEGAVVGVVQLKPVGFPNGSHRAEVSKLLVHRSARGRGVGSALMAHLESEALRLRRWLLVLDTRTGSDADAMYVHWGWQPLGVVEDYAMDPDGSLQRCTFYTKRLR